MATNPFRFAVTALPAPNLGDWASYARAVEADGFDALLIPENYPLPDGFTAAGVALGATTTLEVGTFVVASPLHDPRHAAWQARSLATVSGGRFRLGIGTGRPDVAADAEALGVPYGTAGERLARVQQTIDALAEIDGDGPHTPVLLAAGGPKALALGAARADTVALAVPPSTTAQQLAAATEPLRGRVEIAASVFVVGREAPEFVQRFIGSDLDALAANDSPALLDGDTDQICETLIRRREQYGISLLSLGGHTVDAMRPVVARLRGR
ncbi:LLM class flavin-dependent oxidoreductase [Tsukamurella sp. 8F]|uniref:LLM class flavin-dependent oxidoreductase n=1 Tax=unclassified Tsukamurella TaxID=2633480 RepID=UPI0023B939B4|nr:MULTISPECIES: LLM class flavin-dependent oxidoreductase [unclassified Tsukamurella]MDF0529565.1 LLM class flavin-dependent oxidoreductase [Tsukamurella sp. 8J]MDF0585747.1 LLM class flavin-dependent oxidoreductase [Tsukamurella sp. 8F]